MLPYIDCSLLPESQVLQSVLPIKDEEVVLGQYEGYRDDPTVPDQSNTPTFATVVLRIHNERWEGTIYITILFIFLLNLIYISVKNNLWTFTLGCLYIS